MNDKATVHTIVPDFCLSYLEVELSVRIGSCTYLMHLLCLYRCNSHIYCDAFKLECCYAVCNMGCKKKEGGFGDADTLQHLLYGLS